MSHIAGIAALVAASFALAAGGALAEPLPKEECDKLQAEQTSLSDSGVREQLERGAEWGKANLSPVQLKGVERFILLEEQLSFRCGLAKLRASLPEADEDAERDTNEKAVPPPTRAKPNPPPETRTKREVPVNKKEARPTAKAAPKPKMDDAYRPPRKDLGADPFAGKLPDRPK